MQHKKQQNQLHYRIITLFALINVFIWGFTIMHLVTYVNNTELHEQMLKGLTVDRIDYQAFH